MGWALAVLDKLTLEEKDVRWVLNLEGGLLVEREILF